MRDVVPAWCRDLPDTAEPAERFKDAALGFARGEARSRKLIGEAGETASRGGCRLRSP